MFVQFFANFLFQFGWSELPVLFSFQLIVATSPEEVARLDNLHERGIKNEVPDLKIVGPEEIKEIEPNCVVRYNFVTWPFILITSLSHIYLQIGQSHR